MSVPLLLVALALLGAIMIVRKLFGKGLSAGAKANWPRCIVEFAAIVSLPGRREWKQAMLAELEAVPEGLARWCFALNCAFACLFVPASPCASHQSLTPSKMIVATAGLALVWGFIWAASAFIVVLLVWIIDPGSIDHGEEPYRLAPLVGLAGCIVGGLFGSALLFVAKGRIFAISLGRACLIGGCVGALLPIITDKDGFNTLIVVVLGVISALISGAILRAWAARILQVQAHRDGAY